MKKANSDAAELIRDLIKATDQLPWGNEEKLDLLQLRVKMAIRRLFEDSHEYRQDLDDIRFPPKYLSHLDEYLDDWFFGEARMQNLLKAMLEDIELFGVPSGQRESSVDTSRQVFVAHGRDEGMREATARTLEKLGLSPVLMREHPGEGRTVAEQLEHYSNVSYAIILLSPDDMAYPKGGTPAEARPRARQNVIDELGFFRGRLGRENIFVLYRKEVGFELPSNLFGVVYVPYDDAGHWRFRLVQELQRRGFLVQLDMLFPDYPEVIELIS